MSGTHTDSAPTTL